MKAKPVAININLVPKDPFFDTIIGKTLRWALSVGRYIVMFTELIVVLSFVTRFYLDRRVTDINRDIFQKRAIIQSYGDFEDTYRNLQEKISQYEQVQQQENLVDTFPLLAEVIPVGIQLEELVIFSDKVNLTGTVTSQQSLNILINNLQISPDFTNVIVNTIETEETSSAGGFTFNISAQTKGAVIGTPS